MQTEQSENSHDFWDTANKYSWSNGEYEFLKEMSFIMVNLHHEEKTNEQEKQLDETRIKQRRTKSVLL
tara:strand:- start:3420 stop:3623 length:204 start_codon:yes stop_codon:yes gene_type:complete